MKAFLTVIEYVGAIAFTITGTIVALRKKTDFVGALILALFTAFGGGFIRDLTLGINPPHLLFDKNYQILALVCIVVCFALYHSAFSLKINRFITRHEHDFVLEFTDAIGLAFFCVFGVETAMGVNPDNKVLLVFCGVITGVGGGILRDVCVQEIPFIFTRHIYFVPALLGSILYSFTCTLKYRLVFMIITVVLIIGARVLAFIFRWNLPNVARHHEANAKKLEIAKEKQQENN